MQTQAPDLPTDGAVLKLISTSLVDSRPMFISLDQCIASSFQITSMDPTVPGTKVGPQGFLMQNRPLDCPSTRPYTLKVPGPSQHLASADSVLWPIPTPGHLLEIQASSKPLKDTNKTTKSNYKRRLIGTTKSNHKRRLMGRKRTKNLQKDQKTTIKVTVRGS